MSEKWIYLDVNPEPWAVGPLSLGRRNGKMFPMMGRNQSVHAFKEAVKGELEGTEMLPKGTYYLEFFFSRRIESYTGETGRKTNAHVADATNMQKALEDALQGVLFDNDRDVADIRSVILAQSPGAQPYIVIHAKLFTGVPEVWAGLPLIVRNSIQSANIATLGFTSDNTWPPR